MGADTEFCEFFLLVSVSGIQEKYCSSSVPDLKFLKVFSLLPSL